MSPNFGPFPFPKELFLKIVRENNGYFPVRIQALPEGTCVHVHTPVYQVGGLTGRGCVDKISAGLTYQRTHVSFTATA